MKVIKRLPLLFALLLVSTGALCVFAFGSHAFMGFWGSTGSPPAQGGGPAGVVCDQGPNTTLPTGTIGSNLTTAGFTHCALNADFTDNSGATTSGGFVMNNPNTYINECGASQPFRFYIVWSAGFNTNADEGGYPCNRVSIVNDGGSNALTWTFAPSDVNTGTPIWASTLWWPGCGNPCTSQAPWLPTEMYIETTYRVGGLTQSGAPGFLVHAIDMVTPDGVGGPSGFIDFDALENYVNGGGPDPCCTATSSWDNYTTSFGKQTSYLFWNPDEGNLHKLAYIFTSDAGTNVWACVYQDDAPAVPVKGSTPPNGDNCNALLHVAGDEILHDQRFTHILGPHNRVAGTPVATLSIFVHSIRIFTCATYKTTGCPGTLITN